MTLVATAIAVLTSGTAQAAPGDLDPSFGTGGVAESTHGTRDDSGRVALGPAGEVLLVGSDVLGGTTKLVAGDADGDLGAGTAITGGRAQVRGRPVVWGDRVAIADGDGVTHVGQDGTGGAHVVVPGLGDASWGEARALVPDGDGLLVVGGPTGTLVVARLAAGGGLDPAFTTVSLDLPGFTASDAAMTSAGDLLVAGEDDGGTPFTGGSTGDDDRLRVVQLAGRRTLGWSVTTGAGVTGWNVGPVAIDAEDRLLVLGNSETTSPGHLHVARVLPAGSLDTGYGTAGLARASFPPLQDGEQTFVATAGLAVDPQGRAVAAGTLRRFGPAGMSSHLALARLTGAGEPDASFGTGGRATPSAFGGTSQAWYGLAIQPSGHLVLAGQVSRASGERSSMALARVLGGELAAGAPPNVSITSPADDQVTRETSLALGGALGTAAGDAAAVTLALRKLPDGNPVAVPATVDGATWTATATGLTAGRYRLTVTQEATDARPDGTRTVEFRVDRTAPVVAIATPADGTTGQDRTVGGTRGTQAADAEDSADVATVVLERRPAGAADWQQVGNPVAAPGATWSVDQGVVDDGVWELRARQADDVGNVGTSPVVTYTLDRTAPALTLTERARYGARPALAGTRGTLAPPGRAADLAQVTVELRRDGQSLGTHPAVVDGGSWSLTWPEALTGGDAVAVVRQADAVGNVAEVERAIALDTTPPAPTVTRADALRVEGLLGTAPGDEAAVALAVLDAEGDEVAAPEATVAGGGWSAPLPAQLPEGAYTLRVRQTDDAGNVAVVEHAFTLARDRTAPKPTVRLTANSGDLVQYELGRGAEAGDLEWVQLVVRRLDVPATLQDERVELPGRRVFQQRGLGQPPGEYEIVVTQQDESGNTGTASIRFTKTPGGFEGVQKTDATGQLPAGFAPSRLVPTDAAGRVPDVVGDALDRASDRIQRAFGQVSVRLKARTASESSLGRRPGGGSWKVGDVLVQDPKAGAQFTTSLGEEDVATLTYWAGEPGGGGADCRELRTALRGDDLQTALAQLTAAKCAAPDIEVQPSRAVTEPTVRRADRDGDVVVLMPVRQQHLDLRVWQGYGLRTGANPGPSAEDFALSAGVPNVASVLVWGRGVDDQGRPQLPKGARVRFDLHEVGGVDKTATVDASGVAAVGGLAPKRPGLVHVHVETWDQHGERAYGYTAFRVVDRCRTGDFVTIIGESWDVTPARGGGCRIEKGAAGARAASIAGFFAQVAEALKGFGGQVAQAAATGREGIVTAFRSAQAGAVRLVADVQREQARLAEISRAQAWFVSANGVVAAGGANVVAAGGANVVAAGGANVVAAGGANVVAAGGLNLRGKGGAVIAAGGGNVVAAGGGNLKLLPDGSGVIAPGGANVVAAGGANVVAAGGAN